MQSTDQEDTQLIGEFQKGNKKSFESLYEKYRDQVFLYFMSNGIPVSEARDATQDVFISILKYLRDNDLKVTFKSLLNQSIRNRLTDYYRLARRRLTIIALELMDEESESILVQSSADNLFNYEDHEYNLELFEIITRCLKKIKSERTRTIFMMWLENFRHEQIAEIFDMPIGSISSRLSRYRQSFFNCVKKNYFE